MVGHDAGRLRIAQIAPLWTSVPPDHYGGAELMVHWLTETLVSQGHDVTLFASGDSHTSARLVATVEQNMISTMEAQKAYNYENYAANNMAQCLSRAREYDVIHCHMGAEYIPYGLLSSTPVVHTLHAGLDSPDDHWVLQHYPQAPIAAISRAQISSIPTQTAEALRVIYHGCDMNAYRASMEAGNYLAFIGRMGPHKNPAGAIRIAKALGEQIRLAGCPQTRAEQVYFDEEVMPQVDGEQVVYLGPVGHADKTKFLRGASALLFPIEWEEPFGLVMIEAMACGTPVVACCRGSVPEVIDNGITGFHTGSEAALPDLVRQSWGLDRAVVRAHAEQRFGLARMADDYLLFYRDALTANEPGRSQLHAQ